MFMVHDYALTSPIIFACAQRGCGACLERLLRHHEGLIHAVIRHSWVGESRYDDLLQEGRIALWRAIGGFAPQKGYAFSTYAWPIIERQIWWAIRQEERQVRAPPLPWSRAPDPERQALAAWQAAHLERAITHALAHLEEHARDLMVAAYGLDGQEPCSLAAIARRQGVSRERVRQRRNDALVVLRLAPVLTPLARVSGRSERHHYRRCQQLSQRWLRRRRGRQP